MTRREATPAMPPERPSNPPMRIKIGPLEIFTRSVTVFYGGAIAICAYAILRVAPPAFDAIRDLTRAMTSSAEILRLASADAAAAREGVERLGVAQVRVEERLGRIESEVGALRVDMRAVCAGKR